MNNYNLFWIIVIASLVMPCRGMEAPQEPSDPISIESLSATIRRYRTFRRPADLANFTRQLNDFITQGGNINTTDAEGNTLLHTAVVRNNIPAAQVLLNNGIHVNTRDAAGDTPLLIAVRVQNPEMVKILLTRQPDTSIRNERFGNTALQVAKGYAQTNAQEGTPEQQRRSNEIVQLLEKAEQAKQPPTIMPAGITPEAQAKEAAEREIEQGLITLIEELERTHAEKQYAAEQKEAQRLRTIAKITNAISAVIAGNNIEENLKTIESQPINILQLVVSTSFKDLVEKILKKITPYNAPKLKITLIEEQEKADRKAIATTRTAIVNIINGIDIEANANEIEKQKPNVIKLALMPYAFKEIIENIIEKTIKFAVPKLKRALIEERQRIRTEEEYITGEEEPEQFPIGELEGASSAPTGIIPSKKIEFPYQRGQWPGGGPEEPEWQPLALGGYALLSLLLSYIPQKLPQVRNEIDLYTKLMTALRQKNYDYAYRLADANRPLVERLSLDENKEMKKDLEHLIDQKLVNLIEETSKATRSSNPFTRYLHPSMAKPWKQLTDLLHLIHHPTE